jgi:guanyl-specific ribonuclease Sa
MNKIKKYQCTIIALIMLFILTACGTTDKGKTIVMTNDANQNISEETTTESPQTQSSQIYETEPETKPQSLQPQSTEQPQTETAITATLDEDATYTTKEDVALYIYTYGHLPNNFITKKEAENLGWSGGSLEPYAPGKCIGGSRFGNYEGILPEKDGRTYTECDIDTLGADKRGAKRIVFSNDGLIYYTEDHYETFELLYGDE